ncbi:MAG: hypothetical protein BGO11_06470, partial [Solirubrobacterales bacterium 70-9]
MAAQGEETALELGGSSSAVSHTSGGGSIVRTIVGLAIVLAVIFGLRWVLKQFKAGRERKAAGNGLESVATLSLGTRGTLHVVRAGREVLVVGSGEHGVTPVRAYTEAEARALGLLDGEEDYEDPAGAGARSAGDASLALKEAAPTATTTAGRALETLRA